MAFEEPIPARIDRYVPLKRLAVGGMAEIFLAKQSGLEGFEKIVVLKRILSNLAQDEEFVSMFLDEARIAAKLSHPNIVQIYDLGKWENSFYIAMEYVSGRNVQHVLTKQSLQGGNERVPIEFVCRMIAGACEGLYYAHTRNDPNTGKALNIIHRDISPQNILVSFAGNVKVVDFGIAKASTQLAQTRAGVLKGKYAYMSPEQVKGESLLDHRSDIFALGVVMYEMLTGVRPFERDTSIQTLKAVVKDRPSNPTSYNPNLPPELIKLLAKALEKSPDKRYKNAQDFQLAIEDFLETFPRKSNNVRFSQYLYNLFDDELNAATGSMVVDGVGQVIIPTSQGQPVVAAISEDVDHKTLTHVLSEEPAMSVAAPRSPVLSMIDGPPPPPLRRPDTAERTPWPAPPVASAMSAQPRRPAMTDRHDVDPDDPSTLQMDNVDDLLLPSFCPTSDQTQVTYLEPTPDPRLTSLGTTDGVAEPPLPALPVASLRPAPARPPTAMPRRPSAPMAASPASGALQALWPAAALAAAAVVVCGVGVAAFPSVQRQTFGLVTVEGPPALLDGKIQLVVGENLVPLDAAAQKTPVAHTVEQNGSKSTFLLGGDKLHFHVKP
jgi:serine/threonine protein kinase